MGWLVSVLSVLSLSRGTVERDCNCVESREKIWSVLFEITNEVKTADPYLRTSEVNEVCKLAYPHIFRSFTIDTNLDQFHTLTDCPLGLSTAALFCAQSTAGSPASMNLLDVALRSWEIVASECIQKSEWPISFSEIMTQFQLMLEVKEEWKFMPTEFPVDDKQKLFNIRWKRGVEAEADFWRGKFTPNQHDEEDWRNFHTWISDPSKIGWFRHDSPCDYLEAEKFNRTASAIVRVLNAGSGPFVPDRLDCPAEVVTAPIALYNSDGLGRYYMHMHAKLVKDARILPPIFSCAVEELHRCFPADFFDLSHMQNALDHAYDPMAGILQLLFVTKRGGHVILRHAENEGVPGGFIYGLHQWAFTTDAATNDFVIWNPHRVVNVNQKLANIATVTSKKVPQKWGANENSFFIFVDIMKL